jgi:integrative and conjugative element protein (TIGR02256 family)
MAKLFRLGSKYYPKEYGGLFVGRYVNDYTEVIIEDTVLPKKFKSSAISFERGVQGLRTILQKFFNRAPSLIYVGEWHTHPDGKPIPSSTDSTALRTIAVHDEVFIENPILLIIGVSNDDYEIGFHVLYKNNIYGYEKEG